MADRSSKKTTGSNSTTSRQSRDPLRAASRGPSRAPLRGPPEAGGRNSTVDEDEDKDLVKDGKKKEKKRNSKSTSSARAGIRRERDTGDEDEGVDGGGAGDVGNKFIVLPGTLTGDIWHVAAATILWENQPESEAPLFPDWCPRTVIVVWENDMAKSNGRGSFNYLSDIGLKPTLVKVEGTGEAIPPLRCLTHEVVQDHFNEQWGGTTSENLTFDDVLKDIKVIPPMKKTKTITTTDEPKVDESLIQLLRSTAIVMQLMAKIGTENAQEILRGKMSKDIGLDQIEAADKLLVKLRTEILKTKRQTEKSKIVLFNYRKGEVNKQHDGNRELFDQVQKICMTNGIAFIVVPQMGKGGDRKALLSSLNDPRSGLSKVAEDSFGYFSPFADDEKNLGSIISKDSKRTQALIWSKIATELKDKVIGYIGGRSGSMDLPSFLGLNCISWDEPLLTVRFSGRGTPPEGINRKEILPEQTRKTQGPQLLRLLNQRSIMNICYLDITGYKPKARKYKAIEAEKDGEFLVWLDQAKAKVNALVGLPEPEDFDDDNEIFSEFLASIEHAEFGIKAVNLEEYRTAAQRAVVEEPEDELEAEPEDGPAPAERSRKKVPRQRRTETQEAVGEEPEDEAAAVGQRTKKVSKQRLAEPQPAADEDDDEELAPVKKIKKKKSSSQRAVDGR